MIYLQRIFDGNVKKVIGGMFIYGYLYYEVLKELEEQFGNGEVVVGVYLKIIFDYLEVFEDNFVQLRFFYNILYIVVFIFKSLSYKYDFAVIDNFRRVV